MTPFFHLLCLFQDVVDAVSFAVQQDVSITGSLDILQQAAVVFACI
jgi:hypothetical protein